MGEFPVHVKTLYIKKIVVVPVRVERETLRTNEVLSVNGNTTFGSQVSLVSLDEVRYVIIPSYEPYCSS